MTMRKKKKGKTLKKNIVKFNLFQGEVRRGNLSGSKGKTKPRKLNGNEKLQVR